MSSTVSKVSLIVPVYRAEPWIDECIASIRAQTYKDIELIVIDDPQGSGAAVARNRGLDKANGEFIAFCDADDYLAPDGIERMVAAMQGVDFVAASFRKFGEFDAVVTHPEAVLEKNEVAHYVMGNLKEPRHNQLLSGCWAKLYKKSLVGRFPDLTTAEDMAFNFDYLMRCRKVRFIPEIVYHNRKRQGSLSTFFDADKKSGLFGFLGGLKYVETFLYSHGREWGVDDALDNSKAYHACLYFMRICDQNGGTMRENLMRLYP